MSRRGKKPSARARRARMTEVADLTASLGINGLAEFTRGMAQADATVDVLRKNLRGLDRGRARCAGSTGGDAGCAFGGKEALSGDIGATAGSIPRTEPGEPDVAFEKERTTLLACGDEGALRDRGGGWGHRYDWRVGRWHESLLEPLRPAGGAPGATAGPGDREPASHPGAARCVDGGPRGLVARRLSIGERATRCCCRCGE